MKRADDLYLRTACGARVESGGHALHSTRELQDVPPRFHAGRARAKDQGPAGSLSCAGLWLCAPPALVWLSYYTRCAEPRRRPTEEKRQCLLLARRGRVYV